MSISLAFYRNMLVGDLVYVTMIFGAYAVVVYGVRFMLIRQKLSFSN